METVRNRDLGWKKVGSGIRDKHPGSATLLSLCNRPELDAPFLYFHRACIQLNSALDPLHCGRNHPSKNKKCINLILS